jgi:uncharacterized protein YkwD
MARQGQPSVRPGCWLFILLTSVLLLGLASGHIRLPAGVRDGVARQSERILGPSHTRGLFEPGDGAKVTGPALDEAALDEIRAALLKAINDDRMVAGLPPVTLDEDLTRLGNAHCREMVRGRFASHWTPDGLKPYHRYSLAGGSGHHEQNVAWRRDSRGYGDAERALADCLDSHAQMMAERPPNDGHRRTILSGKVDRVGIGLATEGEYLAFTHEFASDAVRFLEPMSRRADPKGRVKVAVEVPAGHELSMVVLRRERPPEPLTGTQLMARGSYGYEGEDVLHLRPMLEPGWHYSDGSRGELERRGSVYSGEFVMPSARGLYTLLAGVDGEVRAALTLVSPGSLVDESRYQWP